MSSETAPQGEQGGGTKLFRVPAVYRPPALSGVAANLYALQQDLEVARRIQGRLLSERPQLPGFDFDVVYQPAGEVGGDFFDFIPLDGNRLAVVIADASGKGLAGALLMVEARAVLRAMASVSSSPREILLRTNRVLLRDLDRGMFVSIFFVVLDPVEATMTMVSAGHTPLALHRARTGQVTDVQPRGLVLGAATEEMFSEHMLERAETLEPGDRFVLFTDGVSELMNPVQEEYGMERLHKVMAASGRQPSDIFLRRLTDDLEMHRAGQLQSDDITIVTGRMHPE